MSVPEHTHEAKTPGGTQLVEFVPALFKAALVLCRFSGIGLADNSDPVYSKPV